MFCLPHHTVLSFAHNRAELIKIRDLLCVYSLSNCVQPLLFLLGRLDVVNALLVGVNQREKVHLSMHLIFILSLVFVVDAGQRPHVLVLPVTLLLVTVKLLADQNVPQGLQFAALLLLFEDLALVRYLAVEQTLVAVLGSWRCEVTAHAPAQLRHFFLDLFSHFLADDRTGAIIADLLLSDVIVAILHV